VELVVAASSRLLALSDLGVDEAEARGRVERALEDGSAVEAYERWVQAQGGDPDESVLPTAPVVRQVEAARAGYVAELGAIRVGQAALHLGAGRQTKDDAIDHGVGVLCLRKRGDRVAQGEALSEIHARTEEAAADAARELESAYVLAEEPPPRSAVVIDVIA
jgi:pyrimidine-nucleoside phosphorylase